MQGICQFSISHELMALKIQMKTWSPLQALTATVTGGYHQNSIFTTGHKLVLTETFLTLKKTFKGLMMAII